MKEKFYDTRVRMADNPLHSWRDDNGVSRVQVAALLKVTVTSLYIWESGAGRPSDESMEKLAVMMDKPNLRDEWMDWYNSVNPSIKDMEE